MGFKVVYLIQNIMANVMTFNFNENYSIEINIEDADSLQMKLATILDSVSTVSHSEETQVAYITGERNQTEEENEEMYLDNWVFSIYSPDNERNRFTKPMGDTTIYIRAKNTITGNYEEFSMDASRGVDALREMMEFLQQTTE